MSILSSDVDTFVRPGLSKDDRPTDDQRPKRRLPALEVVVFFLLFFREARNPSRNGWLAGWLLQADIDPMTPCSVKRLAPYLRI